jgi:phosphatidylinositol dimannoside acyltransferase
VGGSGRGAESWRATATYLTYRGLGTAMGRVPEPVSRAAAAGVVWAMARRGGSAVAMNERHLGRVLASECPDGVVPDEALIRRWTRRSFAEYGRYWVDGARLPYTEPDEVVARMRFEHDGEQIVRDAMAQGRGVIMALPHVGSWEWGGAWLALEDMPMTAVVERVESERLFEWFVAQRAEMGLTAVPLGDGSSAVILRTLKAGGLVGLVSDRDLVGNGIEVEFFGETTTMPAGPATLALRTGAQLVTGAVYSGPGRDHRALVQPPLDTTRQGSLRQDVSRLTQGIATRFEGLIRQAPDQWHVFQPLWLADRVAAS